MKKTKFLALLLVAVMVFSVITACTKKGDSDQPGGDQPGGTVTEPGGTTTPDEKPAGQKLEPITFTMFVAGPGEAPPKDNKIVKKLQEITGVTIDFEFLVGDMEQKVGIMIAGGDYRSDRRRAGTWKIPQCGSFAQLTIIF